MVAERAGLDESVALRSLRLRLEALESENRELKHTNSNHHHPLVVPAVDRTITDMPSPIHKDPHRDEEADDQHSSGPRTSAPAFLSGGGGEEEEAPLPLGMAPEPCSLHSTLRSQIALPSEGESDDEKLTREEKPSSAAPSTTATDSRPPSLFGALSRTAFDDVVLQHPRFATAMAILSDEERASIQLVWEAGRQAVLDHYVVPRP